jgi:GDPmannose 4,6-dehydratase
MGSKRALITGITGQDGSYLAELLLEKGYEVYGLKRYCATENTQNIDHLNGKVKLIVGDLLDASSLYKAIEEVMPDEIYNLGAISYVGVSWDLQFLVRETNYFGLSRLLHAVHRLKPSARVYQASTSEMFGGVEVVPQNEQTPFKPVSPYAEAKAEAHALMQRVRQHGLFTSCGILFNHESPRRGLQFVTRKITDGVARILLGHDFVLRLGNMNSEKDWGFAGDYVKAMWLMLQHNVPYDFVVGTGEKHTVREFVESAFASAGKKIQWEGEGVNEKGYVDGRLVVEVDPTFFRPHDTSPFLADPSKAKRILGWAPEVSFKQLVDMMVKADLARLQ